METFGLRITSSSGMFYNGPCESIVLPTDDGEYGILAHHESVVVGICVGEARFKVDGEWRYIAIGQGFARTINNKLYVVVDSAERPEDIDEKRALEAKERAEERMQLKKSRQEFYRGQLAMTRAMSRLKVKEKKYM